MKAQAMRQMRALQLIVGLVTFLPALVVAIVLSNTWPRWAIVVVLAFLGVLAEWMVARHYSRAAQNERYYDSMN